MNIPIIGTPAAGTIDFYLPNNFTVREGQKVTLAILNTDDNTHGLVMKAFGVDTGKIPPGQTYRVTFVANQTGTFEFSEPPIILYRRLGEHLQQHTAHDGEHDRPP